MNSVPLEASPDLALWSFGVFVVFMLVIFGVTAFVKHVFERPRLPALFAVMAAFLLFGAVLMFSAGTVSHSTRISPVRPAVLPQPDAPTLFAEFPEAAPPVVESPSEASARC